MEKETLVAIVKRSQAGDPAAQEELILEVQQSIYYQCLKFLHHSEDAQDATQDILINMLTKLNTLNQPEAFWGWLNRMTANHCKNLLRKTGELQIPEDEEGNSLLDTFETLDEQMVPDRALDNEETRRMVIEMIDALPAPQRMCVIMYYYNEMSVKDIAAALEVSENTIKSRLNYARKAIKEGAEKYKKQGIKLYGLSPLPFLLYFLLKDADASALGANACQVMAGTVLTAVESTVAASAASAAGSSVVGSATGSSGGAAAVASAAEGAAAKTGLIAAVKGASLTTKIVAGALSAAVIFGGGGLLLSTAIENNEPPAEPAPIVSVEPQPSVSTTPEIESSAPNDQPAVSMSSFLLDCLNDAEWATYAKLIDFDGNGVEELLLLGEPSGLFELHDGAAWIELQSAIGGDTTGIIANGGIDQRGMDYDEITLLRHIDTGAIYMLCKSVYTYPLQTEDMSIVDSEYAMFFADCIFPFLVNDNTPGLFYVFYDPRDTQSQPSQAEFGAYMTQFEVIDVLFTTEDETSVDEVRQQLENAAN